MTWKNRTIKQKCHLQNSSSNQGLSVHMKDVRKRTRVMNHSGNIWEKNMVSISAEILENVKNIKEMAKVWF